MAITTQYKAIVLGGGALLSLFMGYSVLFPNVTSKYANSAEVSVTQDSASSQNADRMADPSSADLASDSVQNIQASVPAGMGLSEQEQAQLMSFQKWVDGLQEEKAPLTLEVKTQTVVQKSNATVMASLDANLREQQSRHASMSVQGLGLDASRVSQPVPVATVDNTPGSYPITLSRLEGGTIIARVYYQGQWHRVSKGSELQGFKVLGVSQSGVTIQEQGQTRTLTPGAL